MSPKGRPGRRHQRYKRNENADTADNHKRNSAFFAFTFELNEDYQNFAEHLERLGYHLLHAGEGRVHCSEEQAVTLLHKMQERGQLTGEVRVSEYP